MIKLPFSLLFYPLQDIRPQIRVLSSVESICFEKLMTDIYLIIGMIISLRSTFMNLSICTLIY